MREGVVSTFPSLSLLHPSPLSPFLFLSSSHFSCTLSSLDARFSSISWRKRGDYSQSRSRQHQPKDSELAKEKKQMMSFCCFFAAPEVQSVSREHQKASLIHAFSQFFQPRSVIETHLLVVLDALLVFCFQLFAFYRHYLKSCKRKKFLQYAILRLTNLNR